MLDQFEIRTGRIMTRIDELASYSDDDSNITRIFGSTSFIAASKKVFSWMEEAGLETVIDNIGNIRGRYRSTNTNAKTFIIASHIDSVVNAGKFDGPLGVVMGLDLTEELVKAKLPIPFNIELIAFSDEEGVRFHSTFLGSRVIAGTFDEALLDKKDAAGITIRELIKTIGGDPGKLVHDAIPANNTLGYFEIHIEQGPVLYEKNIPSALVTAIAGQQRIELVFKGMAGHAGTVPMSMREDALCAAAECILFIESYAGVANGNLVATVGKLDVRNAASNVIPGEVICSLDIRSEEQKIVEIAAEKLRAACEGVCKRRNIELEWKPVQSTMPVSCDKEFNNLLEASISECGYEVVELVSGAGHDAVAMSVISPVAMLFVRCFKGISHNPLENAEADDIKASLLIADTFIHKLISKYNS